MVEKCVRQSTGKSMRAIYPCFVPVRSRSNPILTRLTAMTRDTPPTALTSNDPNLSLKAIHSVKSSPNHAACQKKFSVSVSRGKQIEVPLHSNPILRAESEPRWSFRRPTHTHCDLLYIRQAPITFILSVLKTMCLANKSGQVGMDKHDHVCT